MDQYALGKHNSPLNESFKGLTSDLLLEKPVLFAPPVLNDLNRDMKI